MCAVKTIFLFIFFPKIIKGLRLPTLPTPRSLNLQSVYVLLSLSLESQSHMMVILQRTWSTSSSHCFVEKLHS